MATQGGDHSAPAGAVAWRTAELKG